MEQEYCPCCSNHCHREKLKCKKGKRFFGTESERQPSARPAEEDVELLHDCKKLLRKCAKRARHDNEKDTVENLTEEEMQTLYALLKKCLK